MTTTEWATREVELVKQRNNDPYYVACLDSALKAFKCLEEDGHSGASFGITAGILTRLMDGRPLSPITEKDFEHPLRDCEMVYGDGRKTVQCPRMFGLFREEHKDGTVTYSDNNRIVAYEESSPHSAWHNGTISRMIDEMYPITLPYYAGEKFKVFYKEYLFDEKNGDYDTLWVKYADRTCDGKAEKIELNRFFTEKDGIMVEITKEEFRELSGEEV